MKAIFILKDGTRRETLAGVVLPRETSKDIYQTIKSKERSK